MESFRKFELERNLLVNSRIMSSNRPLLEEKGAHLVYFANTNKWLRNLSPHKCLERKFKSKEKAVEESDGYNIRRQVASIMD